MTGRAWSLVVIVVGLFFASTTIASCGSVECSTSPGSGTFVGTLTSKNGMTATFAVESWEPDPEGTALTTAPVEGSAVVVQYASDEITFLRVGRRYSVEVSPDGNGMGSGVHRVGTCSGGTVYADGTSIDTSAWSCSLVRNLVVGFVAFLVVVLAFLTWLLRRNRRRLLATRVMKERVE